MTQNEIRGMEKHPLTHGEARLCAHIRELEKERDELREDARNGEEWFNAFQMLQEWSPASCAQVRGGSLLWWDDVDIDSTDPAKTLINALKKLWDERDALRARVKELESAHRWKPVNMGWPELEERVLLLHCDGYVSMGFRKLGCSQWDSHYRERVTHWAPLPLPSDVP